MQADPATLALLAAAWVLYFGLHSLLASTRVKALVMARLPCAAPAYRLGYNAIALAALLPLLWLQWRVSGNPLFLAPAALRIAFDLAALAAVATFVWTLRWYDMRAFAGLRAEGSKSIERAGAPDGARAGFTLSPLHRHVRHPWYFLALVIVWTRPMDAAWLVASTAITLYLVIGSRLEDDKLVDTFGETYRHYRERVPGLWPMPGHSLSAAEAKSLMRGRRSEQPTE